MTEELVNRVTACIARSQKLPPEKVTIDSQFEDLGIDSLDGVNILFALETEFNISIPDQGILGIKNVREIIEQLDKLLSSNGSGAAGGTSPASGGTSPA